MNCDTAARGRASNPTPSVVPVLEGFLFPVEVGEVRADTQPI